MGDHFLINFMKWKYNFMKFHEFHEIWVEFIYERPFFREFHEILASNFHEFHENHHEIRNLDCFIKKTWIP